MNEEQLPGEQIISEQKEERIEAAALEAAALKVESSEGNTPDAADEEYDELREQIIGEFLEESAFEEFQQTRPDLWMQVNRLHKILELQEDAEKGNFPSGSCFIHANTPDYQTFCVKRILEIDLESCLVVVEIHGDDELLDGVVMLPLETLSWYGFPSETVKMESHIRGFLAGMKNTKKNK